ncbi:MAG: Rid family detoxifying hydrolase [Candidatus Omnitrophica bacterium]|nr:Rid family detoxifying hydrolase [Candidatus Omnitrophota bacterium]
MPRSKKKAIISGKAPKAVGPYSQAVVFGDLVFVSGQIPLSAESGLLLKGDICESLRIVLKNTDEILKTAGSSLENILKVTVYITDISLFSELNDEYAKHFREPYPAREVIQVSSLPKGANVEISVIAHL